MTPTKLDSFIKSLQHFSEIVLIGPMDFINPPIQLNVPHVFIDGGSKHKEFFKSIWRKKSWSPEIISVGDGDSSHVKLDVLISPQKDFSDLQYALNFLPQQIEKIHLIGFLGGRKDHELINFGEIYHFLQHQSSLAFFDDKIIASSHKLKRNIQGTFSILTFNTTFVKITGMCKYPLDTFTEIHPFSSHGLSNIGHGDISIEANDVFFLFLP
jgi:thiamine pyrophosphokinase